MKREKQDQPAESPTPHSVKQRKHSGHNSCLWLKSHCVNGENKYLKSFNETKPKLCPYFVLIVLSLHKSLHQTELYCVLFKISYKYWCNDAVATRSLHTPSKKTKTVFFTQLEAKSDQTCQALDQSEIPKWFLFAKRLNKEEENMSEIKVGDVLHGFIHIPQSN